MKGNKQVAVNVEMHVLLKPVLRVQRLKHRQPCPHLCAACWGWRGSEGASWPLAVPWWRGSLLAVAVPSSVAACAPAGGSVGGPRGEGSAGLPAVAAAAAAAGRWEELACHCRCC